MPAVHAWGDGMLEKLVDRMLGRTASFNTVQALDYIGRETPKKVDLSKEIPNYKKLMKQAKKTK